MIASRRTLQAACLLLLALAAVALPPPAAAGEIVASYVAKEKEPKPAKGERRERGVERYVVTLASTDLVRRASRVELLLEFYDGYAHKMGEKTVEYEVEIEPDGHDNVVVDCSDPLCRDSYSLSVTVRRADFAEVRFGKADELVFEWNGRRWFLEDRWQAERRAILRSFSYTAYAGASFDGKVLLPGEPATNLERFFRVAKDEVPAGFAKDSTAYEVDYYWSELLPGFVVENGQRRKPKFLDVGISNLEVEGEIAVGELVQLRQMGFDKKAVDLVAAPVCQLTAGHRSLRAHVRFLLGKAVMEGPDYDAVERAIREWFQPVSIREVADTCGPTSGTPVHRWDAATTPQQVEAALGRPEERVSAPAGEVLVYGTLRLKFSGGKLAGFEKRTG